MWERLDDTTGDTQFLRADFCPYGSQSLQEQVAAAAQLAQEAFSSVLPPQRPQGKLVVMAACQWDCTAACPSGARGAQAAGMM